MIKQIVHRTGVSTFKYLFGLLFFAVSFAPTVVFAQSRPPPPAPQGPIDIIVDNIVTAFNDVPVLFAVFAYIFGLIFVISALFKFKDHVENPNSQSLPGVLTRMLVGGGLLSLPQLTILVQDIIGYTRTDGNSAYIATGSRGIGNVINNLTDSFTTPEAFFGLIAYMFGIGLAIWAVVEFIRTSDSPAQAPVRRPIMILLTSSALLAMPTVLGAVSDTLILGLESASNPQCLDAAATCLTEASGTHMGLDQLMVRFVNDLYRPMLDLLGHVSWIAGVAFAFIGVFRLLKSAQDGPRGPVGSGTIATFIAAAALTSIGDMMGSAQLSLFNTTSISTYAVLAEYGGLSAAEQQMINQSIQAVFLFVQVVGYISFVRGIFILRSVAEGNGQATMAAGFTHIIGGALAVNLTALVDAVQSTLGLFGINPPTVAYDASFVATTLLA